MRRVRDEGLAGVRVGVRDGVTTHSNMPDEFIMGRNTREKPSYHWNSLIIRN